VTPSARREKFINDWLKIANAELKTAQKNIENLLL